ncbi:hypothetical protein NicSoilE8_03140 [Arthrobacter sp. NicSoilE8]|nr:hypothetical protein NicSoilE8_03140 [Arthrobacter sp. NicSoilE8]
MVEQVPQGNRGERGAELDFLAGRFGGRVHGRLNAGAGPFDEPRDGPGVIAYVCYKVAAGPARKAGTAVELFIGKFVELTGEERGPAPRLQEVFLQAPIGS